MSALFIPSSGALLNPTLQTTTSCESFCEVDGTGDGACHFILEGQFKYVDYLDFALKLSLFFCKSSTACNVAMKILAPKFGRLSYHYSKVMHLDWFNGWYKLSVEVHPYNEQDCDNNVFHL